MVSTARLTTALTAAAAALYHANADTNTAVADCVSVDCVVSDWTLVRPCDVISQTQTRTRTVVTAPLNQGRACPPLTMVRQCQSQNCKLSPWTTWGDCASTCMRTRTREIQVYPLDPTRGCPPIEETIKCGAAECCMSNWSGWVCDAGTGNQTRTRTVVRMGKSSQGCPALNQTKPCDPVDCMLSETEYDAWDLCDADGQMHRNRTVLQAPLYGGTQCPPYQETADTKPCPVDCVLYSAAEDDVAQNPYSACDDYDNTGSWYKSRVLRIKTQPLDGGAACPADTDASRIDKVDCPAANCVLGATVAGTCSLGPWTKKYKAVVQEIDTHPLNGGTACPSELERTVKQNCTIEEYLPALEGNDLWGPDAVVRFDSADVLLEDGTYLHLGYLEPYDGVGKPNQLIYVDYFTCGSSGNLPKLTVSVECGLELALSPAEEVSMFSCEYTAVLKMPVVGCVNPTP